MVAFRANLSGSCKDLPRSGLPLDPGLVLAWLALHWSASRGWL